MFYYDKVKGLLSVMKQLSLIHIYCLIFEDVPAGLMAGKSAGMKTCAVADKFSEDQIEKKRALADYFIQDYFEVLKGTYEQL